MSSFSVNVPFCDGPKWLSHLEISRQGTTIVIEAVRRSGTQLGEARIELDDFTRMLATIGVEIDEDGELR